MAGGFGNDGGNFDKNGFGRKGNDGGNGDTTFCSLGATGLGPLRGKPWGRPLGMGNVCFAGGNMLEIKRHGLLPADGDAQFSRGANILSSVTCAIGNTGTAAPT